MNIPEGWKLVPINPNKEMLEYWPDIQQQGEAIKAYRLMLAAAQTPPAQSHHELDDADIRAIALDCGFKLKPQPDGLEDLNPYVYRFAREIMSTIPRAEDVEALRRRLTPPAQEDEPVLYQMWHPNFPTWVNCSKAIADKTAARNEGHIIRPLYTRPANDGLRKAAEEACDEIEKVLDGRDCYLDDALINLRAALEGK